ncbi:MAG: hypothetical protein ACJ8FT_08475 [Sphingomonas sp.]
MNETDATLERPGAAGAQVKLCRLDGSEVPVRLRLLGYDGCEFESSHRFAAGERVSIHLYRMGWIRARIVSCQAKLVHAEFDKQCPV